MTGCGKRAVTCLARRLVLTRQLISVISLLSQDTPDINSPANVDAAVRFRQETNHPSAGERKKRERNAHDRLDRVDGQPPLSTRQLISVISLLSQDTPDINSPANVDAAVRSSSLSPFSPCRFGKKPIILLQEREKRERETRTIDSTVWTAYPVVSF
jgi:hypothetical protein